MKKLFLLSIMLLSVLFVNAQKKNANPEEMAQKRVDRLTTQLDLTPEQQEQMYDLVLTQFENRGTKGKGKYAEMTKEEKADFKAERKAAKADFDEQITGILTPQQLETYRSTGKQRSKGKGKAKAKKGKGAAKANKGKEKTRGAAKANKGKRNVNKPKKSPAEKTQKRVDKMTEELGLNARQQEQLFDLYSSRKTKVKGQSKKELSKEDRQAMKEDRKIAKANFDTALAEILTPAQLEKHNNLKAEKKSEKKGKKNKKAKKGKKEKNRR